MYRHVFEVGSLAIITTYILSQYLTAHQRLITGVIGMIIATSIILGISVYRLNHQTSTIAPFLTKQFAYILVISVAWLPYQYWIHHISITNLLAILVIITWCNAIVWSIKTAIHVF